MAMTSARLFVGNLPVDATPETLRAVFSAHGDVQDVHLVVDRYTGRPRGFGFVTMASADQAARAAESVNGVLVYGKPLRVNGMAARRARA